MTYDVAVPARIAGRLAELALGKQAADLAYQTALAIVVDLLELPHDRVLGAVILPTGGVVIRAVDGATASSPPAADE
ncbi:MAG: hypothetical protein U0556_09840 [Dehalococcoidia bacterium]